MAQRSRWCTVAVAAAAVTMVVGAGGTAQARVAAGAPRIRQIRWTSSALAAPLTGRAQLAAIVRKHYGAEVSSGAGMPIAAELITDPIWVTIQGVSYQMQMYAVHFYGKGAPPPDVEVQLIRQDGTDTQWHLYDFSKPGVNNFTSPKDSVASAAISFGTNFGKSRVESAFTQQTPATDTPCKTFDGTKGTEVAADGTISSTQFALATGTTPFFGTITTPPLTGTMFLDPGCIGKRVPEGCPPNGFTELQAGRRTEFAFATDGSQVEELTGTGTRTQAHEVDSYPLPASDFTAKLTPTGAKATIRTGGNPFMEGTAVFTTPGAPQSLGPFRCHVGGVMHHYTVTQYTGMLGPGPKPFLALFDTGMLQLTSQRAALAQFALTN